MSDQPVLCRAHLAKGGQRSSKPLPQALNHINETLWNACITKSNPVTSEGKVIACNVEGTTQLFKANVTLPTLCFWSRSSELCKKIVHFDGVIVSFPVREVTLPKAKICNASQWTVWSQNTAQRGRGTQECCRVSHTMEKGKGLPNETASTVNRGTMQEYNPLSAEICLSEQKLLQAE